MTLLIGDPKEELRLRTLRRRLGGAMGAAAAVAVIALVLHAGNRPTPDVPPARLTTEGVPFVPVAIGNQTWKNGMTARTRPAAPALKPLAVGAMLSTRAGERRRVTLADGS